MREYNLWLVEDNDAQRSAIAALVAASSLAPRLSVRTLADGDSLESLVLAGEIPDILLTDIDLGEESPNGVDCVAKLFSSKKTQVIYTTAYLNLVSDAYKTEHTYLLAKPIRQEQLDMALSKAVSKLEQDAAQTLTFTYGTGVKKLACSSIMWLESSGHRVEVHAVSGMRETYDSLRRLAEKLPDTFARTHKSYIANLAHVDELTQDALVMSDGSAIPVSRKYRHDVKDALMEYLSTRA